MTSTLTIGDFSRATHLSVKMLRHYHELGLLEPVDVDVDSRYRRYAAEQIVTSQIIRRFRERGLSLTGPDGLLKQLTSRTHPDISTDDPTWGSLF